FFHFCHPLRQKLPKFLRMTSEQAFHIQHTRPLLPPIPGRCLPPSAALLLLKPKLQQPHQAHGYEQRLRRTLDRQFRPGATFLPAQPLLQIAETIFLPKARRKQFHHLQTAQAQRRTDQMKALRVSFYFGNHRLDRHLVAADPPLTNDFLPTHLELASVDEGGSFLPFARPPSSLPWRWQALAPLGGPTRWFFGPLLGLGWQRMQAGVRTHARQKVNPRLSEL